MFCSYCNAVILEDEVCPKCGGCADCCACYEENNNGEEVEVDDSLDE